METNSSSEKNRESLVKYAAYSKFRHEKNINPQLPLISDQYESKNILNEVVYKICTLKNKKNLKRL